MHSNRFFWLTSLLLLASGIIWQLFTPWVQPTVWANNHHNFLLDHFFYYWTILAEWPVIVLAIGLALRQSWLTALVAGAFYSLEGLLVNLIKNTVHASRPVMEAANLWVVNGTEIHQWNSFPSGHTTSAFMGFGIISSLIPGRTSGLVCALGAALVGYSRMYLGQHYLRDVMAGETIALILLFILLRSFPYFQKRFKPNK